MKFVLRKFDDFLRGGDSAEPGAMALPDGVSMMQQDVFDPDIRAETFLTQKGADRQALERLTGSAEKARGLPAGILEFTDVCLLPNMGLILDLESRTAWKGGHIGWSEKYSKRFLARHAELDAEAGSFEYPVPAASSIPEVDTCVLIAAEGYQIYGHWIVDFLPRLGMVKAAGLAGLPHYRKPTQDWANKLAALVAPGCFSLPEGLDAGLLRVKRLLVPTSVRKHGVLADRLVLSAWRSFGETLSREPSASGPRGPRNIFVSRRNWSRKRGSVGQIANIENVERRFNRAGFVSVFPEELSFAEQRQLFADASAIAGEDGSGLHNIIFSRPGIRLGVILSNRLNTLHAVIANTLGQSVTYIGRVQALGPKNEERDYNLPVGKMDAAIDELLAASPELAEGA